MSRVTRKPVFGVSDQVLHKASCAATEDGERLEIVDVDELFYLCSKMKGANQLRLTTQLICAFVFAYAKNRFSCERLICLSSILVENSLTILMKVNFFKEIHKNPNS